ncbi:MAG: hypothetical protein JXR31_06665 [Prolixibacteraceae bacterium]|nr:hypothetical protein [Prolixibacteraceae bacterium]MBN2773913.1 hypothetical protein [Prolixibacteraceae bacterium]
MKKSMLIFAVVISAAFILGGCAKVPQAEVDAANAAIVNAEQAEANVYLESEYAVLLDSMNAINTEIEAGKGKLFKSFSGVKAKLAAVESQANELVKSAEAKKIAITEEVNSELEQLNALADENAGLVEKAPKGKEGKAAIDAIKSELSVINTTVGEISQLLNDGNLLTAQSKAKAALEKSNSINAELKSVIEKYNLKKR